MDYIALSGVNFFLKRRKKVIRLLFTALLASVGSLLLTLSVESREIRMILVHFVLNTGMVLAAFGKAGRKEFAENWSLTYLTVLFLGGIMEWEKEAGLMQQSFLLQAFFGALVLTGAAVYLGRRKNLGNQIFPAELKNKGKSVEIKAYWDSGNQLVDPYIGKPVCILKAQKAKQLFDEKRERIRYIPYSSLGNTEGLLPVCNADALYIFDRQRKIEIMPVVVGIAEEGLLEGKEYDLILHVSMLDSVSRQ